MDATVFNGKVYTARSQICKQMRKRELSKLSNVPQSLSKGPKYSIYYKIYRYFSQKTAHLWCISTVGKSCLSVILPKYFSSLQ